MAAKKVAKKSVKKANKSERRSLRSRIRAPRYFREAWRELKRVTWPSRSEAWKMTLAVLLFSGIFAIFVALVDAVMNVIVERAFL